MKRVLATDGLYTSENLFEIKDFYFVGVIRANRIKNGESALNDSIDKSSYEFYYKILNGNKFILTKFNDTKQFYIISNFISAPKSIKRTRWCKKDKKFYEEDYPYTVYLYTKYMKGVDKGNQLISYYELSRSTHKRWKRIFLHLIDISIVNSFIIYKKSEFNKGITQKQFRLDIVRAILKKYDISIINKRNIYYEAMHYPIRTNIRKSWKNCSETKLYITKKLPSLFIFATHAKYIYASIVFLNITKEILKINNNK